MSKMIRLDDDVYSALKAQASREGKTLSSTMYALMHTAGNNAIADKRIASLELKIDELKDLFFRNSCAAYSKFENEWARPDSNQRPPPCEGDVLIQT